METPVAIGSPLMRLGDNRGCKGLTRFPLRSTGGMRLFVAVELSAEVVDAATRLVDQLRQRCQRLAPRSRVSWVPPDRLHLTLRFIGEADESRTSAIEQALTPPFGGKAFELVLGGTGAFPDAGPPRVMWGGVIGGLPSLTALAGEVSARLASVGVPADPRPFSAHLTLARVREAAGLRPQSVFDGLRQVPLGRSVVSETVLFESRPGGRRPEYLARVRTRLGS
jgi:2'-5' RNA ligase